MIHVRRACAADTQAIAEIYNEGIDGRRATFETTHRRAADIVQWLAEETRFPLLVAERDGVVLGWVHASAYRSRACYAGVAEFSVYVASAAQGQGVGNALLREFIRACGEAGFWKLVSRVFPENTASRALCRAQGFREVGIYERHAQLDGRWRDVVIVERLLDTNWRQ